MYLLSALASIHFAAPEFFQETPPLLFLQQNNRDNLSIGQIQCPFSNSNIGLKSRLESDGASLPKLSSLIDSINSKQTSS